MKEYLLLVGSFRMLCRGNGCLQAPLSIMGYRLLKIKGKTFEGEGPP